MNLQQLRYVRETIRSGLSLTAAAERLHTSQPGISRQIRELERELGVEIFVRRGKRVIELTEAGRTLVQFVDRVLQEVDNLRTAAAELNDAESGGFSIAATHTQARYALPAIVAEFRRRHPRVRLSLGSNPVGDALSCLDFSAQTRDPTPQGLGFFGGIVTRT